MCPVSTGGGTRCVQLVRGPAPDGAGRGQLGITNFDEEKLARWDGKYLRDTPQLAPPRPRPPPPPAVLDL
jgi:hypothetical protein